MTSNLSLSYPSDREAFYGRIGEKDMRPLWEVLKGIVPNEPRTKAVPALWRSQDYSQALIEAGEIITAEEAERRVLVLENPGLRGQTRVTQSLYAGVQMVLPGEHAPSHRHTQTALRFVLRGEGALTSVEGLDIPMSEGDLIVTPAWTWHEHANPSGNAVIWLDGLDVPLITMLDAGFAEEHPSRRGKELAGDGASYQRTCHYPFRAMRLQLEAARAMGPADPCLGWKVRYRDPSDGLDPMPTMAAFLQLAETGFGSMPYRSTDGTICVVVSGSGDSLVGQETFAWKAGDIFVLPAWVPHSHHVREEAVIFSFSDRPVQEQLKVWREERLLRNAQASRSSDVVTALQACSAERVD